MICVIFHVLQNKKPCSVAGSKYFMLCLRIPALLLIIIEVKKIIAVICIQSFHCLITGTNLKINFNS